MEVKHTELYEALKALAIYVFKGDGKSIKDGLFAAYCKLHPRAEPKITKSHEFIKCLNLMNENGDIKNYFEKKVCDDQGRNMYPNPKECILAFLKIYTEGYNHFNEEIFNYMYEKLESLFFEPFFKIKEFALLFNFESSDGTEIVLSDNLKVRKLKPIEEKIFDLQNDPKDFSQAHEFSNFIVENLVIKDKFTINSYKKIPAAENRRIMNQNRLKKNQLFDDVVKTFRIYRHSSLFRDNRIYSEPLYLARWVKPSLIEKDFFPDPIYKLAKTDIGQLKNIFRKTRSLKKNFSVAVNRLSLGMERLSKEDKLIDYMVGFEALFTKKKDRSLTPMNHRASLILGGNRENRKKDILSFLKGAIRLRNDIIHGHEYDIGDFDYLRLEELLRQSIKLYFKKPEQFNGDVLKANKAIFD